MFGTCALHFNRASTFLSILSTSEFTPFRQREISRTRNSKWPGWSAFVLEQASDFFFSWFWAVNERGYLIRNRLLTLEC
jgi:hypothetical protein